MDDDDSYISTGREDGDDSDDSDTDDSGDEQDATNADSGDKTSKKKKRRAGLRQEIADLNEKHTLEDENQTQKQGESLADFYSRTATYWNMEAAQMMSPSDGELSNKEMKREGFKLAQDRYAEIQPILERLAALDLNSGRKEKEPKKEKKEKKKKKDRKK